MKFKKYKTERGFVKIEFDEAYGNRCSLQESSSIVPHVWLGLENAKPKYLSENGHVQINTRMHLNKQQAQQPIKRLQKFVDTGRL